MPWLHVRSLLVGMVAAHLVFPSRAHSQTASACVEPDASSRVARAAGLKSDDLDRVARGDVVVRQIAGSDRNEVALLGAVHVKAARDVVVARVVQRFADRSRDGRRAGGWFGTPASIDDLRDFTIDPSDLDAVKACRPGDCDVKLPESMVKRFQSSIDWNAPHPELAASALARVHMAEYVTRYRRAGDEALVRYDDERTPAFAAVAARVLLDESTVLRDNAPALFDFLQRYPVEPPRDVHEFIEWSVDQPPGLRPITSITQIVSDTPPDGGPAFVVGKQLYASHYFVGLLDVRIVMSDPSSPGAAPYVVVRRMLFDHLPSGGLLNTRGRAIARLRNGLAGELEAMRDWAARNR